MCFRTSIQCAIQSILPVVFLCLLYSFVIIFKLFINSCKISFVPSTILLLTQTHIHTDLVFLHMGTFQIFKETTLRMVPPVITGDSKLDDGKVDNSPSCAAINFSDRGDDGGANAVVGEVSGTVNLSKLPAEAKVAERIAVDDVILDAAPQLVDSDSQPVAAEAEASPVETKVALSDGMMAHDVADTVSGVASQPIQEAYSLVTITLPTTAPASSKVVNPPEVHEDEGVEQIKGGGPLLATRGGNSGHSGGSKSRRKAAAKKRSEARGATAAAEIDGEAGKGKSEASESTSAISSEAASPPQVAHRGARIVFKGDGEGNGDGDGDGKGNRSSNQPADGNDNRGESSGDLTSADAESIRVGAYDVGLHGVKEDGIAGAKAEAGSTDIPVESEVAALALDSEKGETGHVERWFFLCR